MANDVVRQTLEYYRQQRDTKLAELARLNFMIAQLEVDLGEQPSAPAKGSEALNAVEPAPFTFNSTAREPELRRDEFVGLSQVAAVRAYLKKSGRAVSLDQLAEAIKKGGATLGGAVPTKTLYVSLARNPNKDFVFLDDNYIGLREFYPSLPKASTARPLNGKKNRGAKKSKTKSRATKSSQKNTEVKQSADESERNAAKEKIKTILASLLHGGVTLEGKQLLKSVEDKLGHKVHPLSVLGVLKDKKLFEKTEGGFRAKGAAA